MSNHLIHSTSPYLLQHAENPVDWHPWDAKALEKARREDKPIFLSIGYAACHWCHVMAHESFEDPETATLLNDHFISIKVDREERPDLDSIYMSAVTAMTGQGGWPMSVFLTPDLHPFYGGTYFPPTARHGLPAFKDLLRSIAKAWSEQHAEILRSSQQIADLMVKQSKPSKAEGEFTGETLAKATRSLIDQYESEHGGWGSAPKFPMPMVIEFLLRRHKAGNADALKPALHTLTAMASGGMYDVVGGGFSRYSTDNNWHVPHFEKMLYDNAQLIQAYLHAWQVKKEPFYRQVVEESLDFIIREMLAPEGGFFSSLDADSEGEEGQFYVWTLDEIQNILGNDAGFFETAYGITPFGNWDGKIVLHRSVDDAALADRFKITPQEVNAKLSSCHAQLLAVRSKRIRPGTDDKVLTSWNGLMLAAFAEAARVLQSKEYLEIAVRNAEFLLSRLRPDGKLHHTYRAGKVGREVFLEDHTSLILGLLELYQTDFNNRWFVEAVDLARDMIARFSDPAGGFFDTPADGETLLTRPKDLQDNATPSGNSLAVQALLKLALFSENADSKEIADKTLSLVAGLSDRYPTAFAHWLSAADLSLGRVKQVAIVGDPGDKRTKALIREVRKNYLPNLVSLLLHIPHQKEHLNFCQIDRC
ncbi:MAG TPA: thioredoxin domain-containing protein [Anaerolineales bacterium]|nr:thioredoxin domain-containing protein [Anaerolineales bacterium]